MSQNLKALLSTAAEMRAVGHSWEAIAKQVRRKAKTCRGWPSRYRAQWAPLYRDAQQRRFDQLATECQTHVLGLMRNEDPKVSQKACDSYMKYGARPFGPNGEMVTPEPPAPPPPL